MVERPRGIFKFPFKKLSGTLFTLLLLFSLFSLLFRVVFFFIEKPGKMYMLGDDVICFRLCFKEANSVCVQDPPASRFIT